MSGNVAEAFRSRRGDRQGAGENANRPSAAVREPLKGSRRSREGSTRESQVGAKGISAGHATEGDARELMRHLGAVVSENAAEEQPGRGWLRRCGSGTGKVQAPSLVERRGRIASPRAAPVRQTPLPAVESRFLAQPCRTAGLTCAVAPSSHARAPASSRPCERGAAASIGEPTAIAARQLQERSCARGAGRITQR